MAEPKCPECGKNSFSSWLHRKETHGTVDIVYCKECGHIIGVVSVLDTVHKGTRDIRVVATEAGYQNDEQ